MNAFRISLVSSLALVIGAGCGTANDPSAGEGEGGAAGEVVESPLQAGSKCVSAKDAKLAKSEWVWVDAQGKLAYRKLPKGERILDFSYAGYQGGGVALPKVAVKKTVAPSGGDDTAAIQEALDAVAADSAKHHTRGAVLLQAGHFHVSKTLTIDGSGVVLRGSGSGAHGTRIDVEGKPRTAVTMRGAGKHHAHGAPATITDDYVPSGARAFHVDAPAHLHVGDAVLVGRTITPAWVHFMGMDHLVRDGKHETWLSSSPGSVIHADRTITAISGHEVTVDAPLPDSYDAKYTTVTVTPYTFAGRIQEVGLESMRLVAPAQTAPISDPTFTAVEMDAVIDGWVKDLVTDEFTFGIVTGDTTKQLTIEDTHVRRKAPIDGSSGYPFSFSIGGQQTLVQRSSAKGDEVFSYATQARVAGPNVVLFFSAEGSWTSLQPHQRWATGLLLDNIGSPGGSIDLVDRGTMGSGHGWTLGFGVVWNGDAEEIVVQRPPGAENWVIGTKGKLGSMTEPGSHKHLPQGIVDSLNKPVAPESLYLAQLCERLGPEALTAIGY